MNKNIDIIYGRVIEQLRSELPQSVFNNLPYRRLQLYEINSILKKISDKKDVKIIDVGTGAGVVPLVLKNLGYEVCGVDYPVTTESTATLNNLIKNGINIEFLQVGVEKIPYQDEVFDLVFLGNVIEHIPHYPKGFIEDIKRVLKKDGFLVIDTKNAVDIKTRLKVLFGVSNWPYIDGIYELVYNPFHHKEYTIKELGRLLELAGFREIESYLFEVFFFKSLKKFKSFSYMGVAEKNRSIFGDGFNYFHIYEYMRLFFLVVTQLFPNLRSDIIAIGKK